MRIATVLHDASPEPDGAPLFPTVALERDGALYRVTALAQAFGPRYAALADDADFGHAVLALRAEPLHEMDRRLRAGERPSAARLLPGTFTWLPPCDADRAALIVCAHPEGGANARRVPAFSVGSARALYGHEATVPLVQEDASQEDQDDASRGDQDDTSRGDQDDASVIIAPSLAVVLSDDLCCASCAEADRAILGYTLLVRFGAGHAAQLGPALVTRGDAEPIAGLRAHLRVDGAPVATDEVGKGAFSPAEAIAWISHHVPLRAGDVIGVGPLCAANGASGANGAAERASAGRVAAPYGARVDFAIERIGKLSGKPVRGPEPAAWRVSSAA
jgi:hypothetical protein